MLFKAIFIGLVLLGVSTARADDVQTVINRAMAGLDVRVSDAPYSRTIEKMYIGYDAHGEPQIGIAHREIKSYKPITGVAIVHRTADGFVLQEALFPDIGKIRDPKERRLVLSVLDMFKNVPFDPHAEKSAVDGLTGATRYGLQASGYLNHMARKIALEMEAKPDWPKLQKK